MRMTLHKMRLENFKGCRQLDLDFADDRTSVAGMNGTGKTTIVDAFCWCLWNHDSHGNAPGSDAFREKPLDADGNVIHNLDTTVELFCTLDGQRFDVKRTQTENWVKKRGNAEATFQGNVSTYWINGVETKVTDYKARVKAIADEDVFRLIGSLSAFNAQDWKKRRAALLSLSGEDVDGELLARDEYRPIADEIASRNISADDLRKVLADQRKNIGTELKMLPVRIDEAKKSIPEFGKTEIKDAQYLIETTRQDIVRIEEQITDAKVQAGGASKRGQILALEAELVSVKRRLMDEHNAEVKRLNDAVTTASENARRLAGNINYIQREITSCVREINRLEGLRDEMRQKYMDIKRKPVAVDSTCPTCGQTIPADQINAAKDKAEQQKREQLADIAERGKQCSEKLKEVESDKDLAEENLKAAEEERAKAEAERAAAMDAVSKYPLEPDWTSEPRIDEIQSEINALNAEQQTSPDAKVQQLTERKRELLALIDKQNAVLARRDVAVDAEQRIKAYTARQQELGAQLSETEIKITLLERFIQDRCAALESSINSHFPTVRWKLFDTQINGGITDCCVAMLNCDDAYVPYETANTAAQIAADVEIIDVLSDRYDVRVPLFIDNAERVNVLPEIASQTITLSVSTDEKLMIKEV